jgi:hypothetical protein
MASSISVVDKMELAETGDVIGPPEKRPFVRSMLSNYHCSDTKKIFNKMCRTCLRRWIAGA